MDRGKPPPTLMEAGMGNRLDLEAAEAMLRELINYIALLEAIEREARNATAALPENAFPNLDKALVALFHD